MTVTNPFNSIKIVGWAILIFIFSTPKILFGQCTSCDVTISNNGNATNTPTDLSDGQTICITANNRSRAIDLRNRNNLTICVAPGANFSGNLNGYTNTGRITINVYGTYEGGLTLNNNLSEFNVFAGGEYDESGTLEVIRGQLTNEGEISRPVILLNRSTYLNSGTQTGNLTMRNNSVLTNEGTLDIDNFTLENNPTILNRPSGSIEVNGTTTFRGTTINEGIIEIDGSANIQEGANFSVLNSGIFEVDDNITIRSRATLVTSNAFNQSPPARIIAENLILENSGSGHSLEIVENTILELSRDLTIDGAFPVFIRGEVNIGRNLTIGNSGGANPTRLTISGNGNVNINRDLVSSRRIQLNDNASLNVGRDLTTQNNGSVTENNITLNGNSSLTVTRNTTANRPINANGTSSVILNGNLNIPNNGGAGLNFSGSSYLNVGGETEVRGPIVFSDNSVADFFDDVNLFNVGNSRIELYNNSDVLISANLTVQANGSSVIVRNTSQLVICNQRPPLGDTEGSFPSQSRWGSTIDPSPAYYGGCRILPVEYLYFNASYNSSIRTGELTWATAKEWENDRFEIERSVNDVKSWETVGQVPGAGYSDQPVEYEYQDMKLPLAGGNIFYRLKQFDFDGEFSYSETKAIRVEPMSGTASWRVYPNPTTGDPINLEMLDTGAYQDEKITVRIVSVTGQYDVIEGTSPSQLSAQLSDILRSKKAGIYTLEISWGMQREYHKVILRR